jgi:hypothetical protein
LTQADGAATRRSRAEPPSTTTRHDLLLLSYPTLRCPPNSARACPIERRATRQETREGAAGAHGRDTSRIAGLATANLGPVPCPSPNPAAKTPRPPRKTRSAPQTRPPSRSQPPTSMPGDPTRTATFSITCPNAAGRPSSAAYEPSAGRHTAGQPTKAAPNIRLQPSSRSLRQSLPQAPTSRGALLRFASPGLCFAWPRRSLEPRRSLDRPFVSTSGVDDVAVGKSYVDGSGSFAPPLHRCFACCVFQLFSRQRSARLPVSLETPGAARRVVGDVPVFTEPNYSFKLGQVRHDLVSAQGK